jgi:hypothetical protein
MHSPGERSSRPRVEKAERSGTDLLPTVEAGKEIDRLKDVTPTSGGKTWNAMLCCIGQVFTSVLVSVLFVKLSQIVRPLLDRF